MTREEAIAELKAQEEHLRGMSIMGREAYYMAIEALEREQKLLDAGYQNATVDFYIGGRLFRAKEIAQ